MAGIGVTRNLCSASVVAAHLLATHCFATHFKRRRFDCGRMEGSTRSVGELLDSWRPPIFFKREMGARVGLRVACRRIQGKRLDCVSSGADSDVFAEKADSYSTVGLRCLSGNACSNDVREVACRSTRVSVP